MTSLLRLTLVWRGGAREQVSEVVETEQTCWLLEALRNRAREDTVAARENMAGGGQQDTDGCRMRSMFDHAPGHAQYDEEWGGWQECASAERIC